MTKRFNTNPNLPVKDPKVMAHLLGLGLDCNDGHKRITQADKFSILGGSEKTHDHMTETLCKTLRTSNQKVSLWRKPVWKRFPT